MKSIPGYPGYLATENGEIVSVREGFERVLKSNLHRGYFRVNVKRDGDKARTQTDVHTLVLFAYKGRRPHPTHQGRHLNTNAHDNRADNLEWGTRRDQHEDDIRHDKTGHKLKRHDALAIHARASAGEAYKSIAIDYGIDRSHVGLIKRKKVWRHLWEQPDGRGVDIDGGCFSRNRPPSVV